MAANGRKRDECQSCGADITTGSRCNSKLRIGKIVYESATDLTSAVLQLLELFSKFGNNFSEN